MCTPDQKPAPRRMDVTVESLDFDSERIAVCLEDPRVQSLALFSDLSEADRERLAADAWAIGLRALGNAYSQARESRLEDVGKTLMSDLDRGLRTHLDVQLKSIEMAMTRYFDPEDGAVTQRLASFLSGEGGLQRALQKFVGQEQSVLARTLADHVGENSELLKRLSPTDKQGLVHVLEERVSAALVQHNESLVAALDPLAENGALAKMLRSLRKEFETANADQGLQLKRAVAALDANDESSALSRLMRETRQTQQTLLAALNAEDPGSPLAAVKRTVETMLDSHGKSQRELLETQQKRGEELDRYVRDVIARMESRKQADATSPRGGNTFEEAVVEFTADVFGTAFLVAKGRTQARAALAEGEEHVGRPPRRGRRRGRRSRESNPHARGRVSRFALQPGIRCSLGRMAVLQSVRHSAAP